MSEPSRLRTALRGFSLSTALRIGRLLVNLVLTGFLARLLGKGGFGQLMAALAVVSVLLCASELGFNRITVREIVRNQATAWQTLGATFYSRLMVGAILYAGLIAYALVAQPVHAPLLLIYGALLLTHAGTEVMSWFESQRKVEGVAWAQLAGFGVSAVCIAIGLYLRAPVWFFALTYNIECWFALATVIFAFHRLGGRMAPWRWSWMKASSLIRESKFELATQLALLLLFRLDTVMVEAMRGEGEAGIYGAAVRVSEVVYFIPVILSSVCLPPLLELRKSDALRYRQRFTDYFAMSLLIAVPCAAFLAFVSPLIVTVLFGRDFSASARILMIHAWSFIPYAIGIARTQYLTAEGRLWVNLPSVALALAVNVVLNWLWIPRYGGEGAAWATLIAYTVAWVLSSFALPGTRDVARLMVRGVAQMPAFVAQSWRHLCVSAARG
jgi:O-antigen/teichoic acid export membrane protein